MNKEQIKKLLEWYDANREHYNFVCADYDRITKDAMEDKELAKLFAIPDVSVPLLELANKEAVLYAKVKHADEYEHPAFERDVSETEIDFARGFVAGNTHKQ